jgi:hypothetical protein
LCHNATKIGTDVAERYIKTENKLMKKKIFGVMTLLLMGLCTITLSACSKNNNAQFTVVFDYQDDSEVSIIYAQSGQKINKPPNPARAHYEFGGWYVDNIDFSEENKWSFVGFPVTSDTVLYAKWIPMWYRIAYNGVLDANYNTDYSVKYNIPMYYTIEDEIVFTPPTKFGYVGSWDIESIPKGSYGDIVITAQLTPWNYTIIYNGNGATSGGNIAESKHQFGIRNDMWGNYFWDALAFEREGYYFCGWSTSANEITSGSSWEDNSPLQSLVKQNNDTIELFAMWEHYITYDGNGATSGTTQMSDHIDGQYFFLRKNGFVKTGYIFDGWALSRGGDVVYTDEQYINEIDTSILYAVWVQG